MHEFSVSTIVKFRIFAILTDLGNLNSYHTFLVTHDVKSRFIEHTLSHHHRPCAVDDTWFKWINEGRLA